MARTLIRKQLGQILLEEGIVSEQQLQKALELQRSTQEMLGAILVQMGFCTEKQVTRAYSLQIGVPFADLSEANIQMDAVRLLPRDLVILRKVVPVTKNGNKLTLAMENPQDVFALDDVRMATGLEVDPCIATARDIEDAISEHYKRGLSVSEAIADMASQTDAVELPTVDVTGDEEDSIALGGDERTLGEEAPIIRMVNAIIFQALRDRATDIHVEPQMRELRVRYRIDGILHEAMTPPKRLQSAIISRLKIMSKLDIAEKRLPQDGRIMLMVEGRNYDFRIATIPGMFGEKIVMRILDKTGILVDMGRMGLSHELKATFEELIDKPYGMVIATGPTGCGKTTTLYSALNRLNNPERNIITIEDPIEYQLEGIAQAQVNVKAGLTFGNALRSILRQDPDVVMVGEIRDKETAEIAINAALTGHLVLTTMHTNDAALTLVRFFHMGVEPFLIASSVIGIASQRLGRNICPKCKEPYEASTQTLKRLGLDLRSESITLYRGKGCETCKYTGYFGRTGIFEILRLDDDIRDLVVKRASAIEIRETGKKKGMKTLLEDGLEKVLEGQMTIEEAIRVVYVR